MNSKVLSFVKKLEGYKTAIKALHWDSDSLSQHELCDKIAECISEFQDTVSEVEQSITGKLDKKELEGEKYNVTSLKKFVEDVLDATNTFYKSIEDEGDTYTGMRSDCESFLSDMQRNLYLVNFTMKEDLKRRLANRINESYRKEENIRTKYPGRGINNMTDSGVSKRINDITKGGQFNTRKFEGISDAFEFYQRKLTDVGSLHCLGKLNNIIIVQLDALNNKSYSGFIKFKEVSEGVYQANIMFSELSDEMAQPEPEMSEPTIEDSNNYEIYGEGRIYRMTGNELHRLVKESVSKLLSETPLNYDIDNFSGRWTIPSNGRDLTSGDEYVDDEGYLDNPNKHDEIEYALADDEWEWGNDMDMKGAENEYSWDRFENKPIAPGISPYYSVGKRAIPRDIDNAIDMRNRQTDWSEKELRHGRRMMDKWVNGQRDNENLEDAWDDLQFEG